MVCVSERILPMTAEDGDDALILRKNSEQLSKSQFTYEGAAIEFFHVRFKGSC